MWQVKFFCNYVVSYTMLHLKLDPSQKKKRKRKNQGKGKYKRSKKECD